jgi:hypothetical protein
MLDEQTSVSAAGRSVRANSGHSRSIRALNGPEHPAALNDMVTGRVRANSYLGSLSARIPSLWISGVLATRPPVCLLKTRNWRKRIEIFASAPCRRGMITILSALASLLSFRVRRRASQEFELIALRHQVSVLRRRRKGRVQLFSTDRLLWVWLYRTWPRVLNAMVLVKPATVIQWNRKGFLLYWRWRSRSRHLGRPRTSTQIRDSWRCRRPRMRWWWYCAKLSRKFRVRALGRSRRPANSARPYPRRRLT